MLFLGNKDKCVLPVQIPHFYVIFKVSHYCLSPLLFTVNGHHIVSLSVLPPPFLLALWLTVSSAGDFHGLGDRAHPLGAIGVGAGPRASSFRGAGTGQGGRPRAGQAGHTGRGHCKDNGVLVTVL